MTLTRTADEVARVTPAATLGGRNRSAARRSSQVDAPTSAIAAASSFGLT